jgi:hypothetical protein
MSKKQEEVLNALRTIAKGYGNEHTGDAEIDATRRTLRILAADVVDALTQRYDSREQYYPMERLLDFARQARTYRQHWAFKRAEKATDTAIAKGEL